ncbi:MAG: type II secretion system protein [Planctomycetota bacterium]
MNHSFRKNGFTLIELLVVVAIIALLIGLLVPVLSSARNSAQLAGSLSNLRQNTIAAVAYSSDNDNLWPILPVSRDAFGGLQDPSPTATTHFFEWASGGTNTSTYWRSSNSGNFLSFADDRPLNQYIYPDRNFADDGLRPDPRSATLTREQRLARRSGRMVDELRSKLDAFLCPGDYGSIARDTPFDNEVSGSQIIDIPDRDLERTGYEDVGTSYMTNRLHVIELARQRNVDSRRIQIWIEAARFIQQATYANPSRFSWLHDQTMWVVPHFGGTGELGNFGQEDKAVSAFIDGSARYVTLERRNLDSEGFNEATKTSEYQMVFDRY